MPDDPEDFRATLFEHIEELRGRLFRIVFMIMGAWAVGWLVLTPVYGYLNGLVTKVVTHHRPGHADVVYHEAFLNATDAFMLKLKISFMIGLVLALPFCINQLWGFIKPGLKASERRPVSRLAPFSVFLFFLGAAFCWAILPSAIGWFTSYIEDFPGTILNQEPGKMIIFIFKMELAFGLAFQLPIVVYLLGSLGILTPDTMLKYWRQATVAIFTISMIVTPSNDLFTMLMMAIPLTFLFIISVFLVKWTVRPKAASDEFEE